MTLDYPQSWGWTCAECDLAAEGVPRLLLLPGSWKTRDLFRVRGQRVPAGHRHTGRLCSCFGRFLVPLSSWQPAENALAALQSKAREGMSRVHGPGPESPGATPGGDRGDPWGSTAGLLLPAGYRASIPVSLPGSPKHISVNSLSPGGVCKPSCVTLHCFLPSSSVWGHVEASFYVEMDLEHRWNIFYAIFKPLEFSVCQEL